MTTTEHNPQHSQPDWTSQVLAWFATDAAALFCRQLATRDSDIEGAALIRRTSCR